MTRTAIYARYSTDLQREASIEDQVRVCKEHVEREGWTLVKTYCDHAISGATITNRLGIQTLLVDARAAKFDMVVAEALDRLSRDQEDVAALFKRLQHLEIPIVTLAEGKIDELHIGFKGTMNALFLKDLAAKIRRGQRGRVAAGYSAGGLSYGYEVVRELDAHGNVLCGKRRINPHEAEVVRRIFGNYVAGRSPRAIATDLNRKGVPSPRGGQWNASTINGHRGRRNGILQNELYIGRLVYNRVRMVKDPETGKRLSRINPKKEWVMVEIPELRIVPDELWDEAQAMKARYAGQPRHKSRRPRRLLSGLLVCGECGGSFAIIRPDRYGCSAHREKGTCTNERQISAGALERRVLAGIKDRLLQPHFFEEFVREFRDEVKRQRTGLISRRRAAEGRISDLDARIRKLVNAIAEGTDTPTIREMLVELEKRKADVASTLEDMEESPVVELHPNLADMYRRKVEALETTLTKDAVMLQEAHGLLRSLIHRIVLQRGAKRGEMSIEVHGEPGAVLALASGNPAHAQLGMIKVVAEGGLEPPTRGL